MHTQCTRYRGVLCIQRIQFIRSSRGMISVHIGDSVRNACIACIVDMIRRTQWCGHRVQSAQCRQSRVYTMCTMRTNSYHVAISLELRIEIAQNITGHQPQSYKLHETGNKCVAQTSRLVVFHCRENTVTNCSKDFRVHTQMLSPVRMLRSAWAYVQLFFYAEFGWFGFKDR